MDDQHDKFESITRFYRTISMSTFESCSDKFLPNVWEILLISPKEVDALPDIVNLEFSHVTPAQYDALTLL